MSKIIRKNEFINGIKIFLFFFKIGCFTFGGGWSIIAQMEQEFVHRKKWITNEDLMDLIAVGKSVPGIMITNVSMLFGYNIAGWFGGICAVLGIVCPAVLILTFVTLGYDILKENPIFEGAMRGIRCAVVPIMGSVVITMIKDALKNKLTVIICGVAFLFCVFTDISNIVLILTGVIVAFFIMMWNQMKNNKGDNA